MVFGVWFIIVLTTLEDGAPYLAKSTYKLNSVVYTLWLLNIAMENGP